MGRKIAVNTRLLLKDKLEGIGTFTAETFKIICRQHPEDEFHFIFDRPYDDEFLFAENIVAHVISPPVRHPLLAKVWYDIQIPRILKKINAEVFVSPDAMTSLRTKIPSLVIIHDINFVHRPADLPKKWREFYLKNTPKFLQHATRVGTVSNFSKRDIIENYGTDEIKIDVIYNGVKESLTRTSSPEATSFVNKFSKGSPYFFYIGSINPRKNIKNLLKAFDRFKSNEIQNFKLIIGGEAMWEMSYIKETMDQMNHKAAVVFTGRLSDHELSCFLSSATALTYIPFFEGFGIPVIEAMSCETAVITSNTTSLPEVCGDAALLVDPENVEEIAAAMSRISDNLELRSELIEKGKVQFKKFSWENSANALYQSIIKTIEA